MQNNLIRYKFISADIKMNEVHFSKTDFNFIVFQFFYMQKISPLIYIILHFYNFVNSYKQSFFIKNWLCKIFLLKVLKKEYRIEVIDLNKLFSEGRIGPIYIDRKDIWNRSVDIRIQANKDRDESMATSQDGRYKLLKNMTKNDKINKLKELGIDTKNCKEKELNKMLMDEWVLNSDDDY